MHLEPNSVWPSVRLQGGDWKGKTVPYAVFSISSISPEYFNARLVWMVADQVASLKVNCSFTL